MITAESFPTPHLALRTNDRRAQARVREFAARQAEIAEKIRVHLAEVLGLLLRSERVELLRSVHWDLTAWRHGLALQAAERLGVGTPLDPSRFVTHIADGDANYDRIGRFGRLREGSTWDAESRTYVGGDPTPASLIVEQYGVLAEWRFDAEAPDTDTLFNIVQLPPRRSRPPVLVPGNKLVRRDAARRVAEELRQRIQDRGRDASRVETGGTPMYAVTATPEHAHTFRETAFGVLADACTLADHRDRVHAWQAARYLLFQGPQFKKGSDAVTRAFIVAVGAALLERAPVLAQDVDLACMVLGQTAATSLPGDDALLAL